MNLLLDSHVLLWALHAPERLLPSASAALLSSRNALHYSAASVWELEIKCSKGKLHLPENWIESLNALGMLELSIDAGHCRNAAHLPPIHQDPFDRMLIAQALMLGLTFVSRDRHARAYGVRHLDA
jgi:PIN domain nuclease of toxin-antitoxin system